jgi:hypothetical protein
LESDNGDSGRSESSKEEGDMDDKGRMSKEYAEEGLVLLCCDEQKYKLLPFSIFKKNNQEEGPVMAVEIYKNSNREEVSSPKESMVISCFCSIRNEVLTLRLWCFEVISTGSNVHKGVKYNLCEFFS